MKTKPNHAIRALRDILDQTQSEFAAMIGVTRDAVVSWELGRNKLSRKFARRIALATGVDEKVLLRGRAPVVLYHPFKKNLPFTAQTYQEHRKSYWGRTDEAAARHHSRNCADALELLFLAAARSREGQAACRLPAVVDSFVAWCRETGKDFQLEPDIQALLGRRKHKVPLTHTYGEWRRTAKEDPSVARIWGFRDDPRKSDNESLSLEAELAPIWQPGYSMRRPAG
jgi:transcriptional regulator with XRE-family HTH domain